MVKTILPMLQMPNKAVAKVGGNIAKKARVDLEQQTGKKIITQDSYLPVKAPSKIFPKNK
jgi:DNA-damage-inducible protein D